jgi:hypothetical protein
LRTHMPREHQPESTRSACNDDCFVAQGIARGPNNASGYPTAK